MGEKTAELATITEPTYLPAVRPSRHAALRSRQPQQQQQQQP